GGGDFLDEPDEPGDVGKGAVVVGADAVHAREDAADLRDLLGDFVTGEDAALPRLGALGKLDLDPADGGGGGDALQELGQGEVAVQVAAAEVSGPDLVEEVGAHLVVGRDAAFAGVV